MPRTVFMIWTVTLSRVWLQEIAPELPVNCRQRSHDWVVSWSGNSYKRWCSLCTSCKHAIWHVRWTQGGNDQRVSVSYALNFTFEKCSSHLNLSTTQSHAWRYGMQWLLISTFSERYHIVDTVIQNLLVNPIGIIYGDRFFYEMVGWRERDQEKSDEIFGERGQSIINGGWCMHDELAQVGSYGGSNHARSSVLAQEFRSQSESERYGRSIRSDTVTLSLVALRGGWYGTCFGEERTIRTSMRDTRQVVLSGFGKEVSPWVSPHKSLRVRCSEREVEDTVPGSTSTARTIRFRTIPSDMTTMSISGLILLFNLHWSGQSHQDRSSALGVRYWFSISEQRSLVHESGQAYSHLKQNGTINAFYSTPSLYVDAKKKDTSVTWEVCYVRVVLRISMISLQLLVTKLQEYHSLIPQQHHSKPTLEHRYDRTISFLCWQCASLLEWILYFETCFSVRWVPFFSFVPSSPTLKQLPGTICNQHTCCSETTRGGVRYHSWWCGKTHKITCTSCWWLLDGCFGGCSGCSDSSWWYVRNRASGCDGWLRATYCGECSRSWGGYWNVHGKIVGYSDIQISLQLQQRVELFEHFVLQDHIWVWWFHCGSMESDWTEHSSVFRIARPHHRWLSRVVTVRRWHRNLWKLQNKEFTSDVSEQVRNECVWDWAAEKELSNPAPELVFQADVCIFFLSLSLPYTHTNTTHE